MSDDVTVCNSALTIIGKAGEYPACVLPPGHAGKHRNPELRIQWDEPVRDMWPEVNSY